MVDNITQQRNSQRPIELLAPARDAAIAIDAIKCGADAVYMGAQCYGARAAAGNSLEDIAKVVRFAHQFEARVYVTLNTIIYESELDDVRHLIGQLYDVGVDALIVQDMAVLEMDIPPIALHASTQCDTRSVAKAEFLESVGFSQIVVARELSLAEIAEIHGRVNVPIEAFVHGALCVSYSGDCQASCMAMDRSANRGECAQMCRLPYTLFDADGHRLVQDKHLLSLRDMNRSHYLFDMMEAGVSSFKIEGRLKDSGYVRNVVSYYRREIDLIIEKYPGKYRRSSVGCSEIQFVPRLEKSFNRGFTPYFLLSDTDKIASIDTPKSQGERVGVIRRVRGNELTVDSDALLVNGDGLGFFGPDGAFTGFRANKVVENKVFTLSPVNVKQGTALYRNRDKRWDDDVSKDVSRYLKVAMSLSIHPGGVVLTITDERGLRVVESLEIDLPSSKTPQQDARRRVLEKTGNTIYRVVKVVDNVGDLFIAASVLAELRRKTLSALDVEQERTYKRDSRRKENTDAVLPNGNVLSYHDNVSNSLAVRFYRRHGATVIDDAIELTKGQCEGEVVVMTTRYCLRREMGKCLKSPQGQEWKNPLYITSANHRFRLDFDCGKCRMKVVYICRQSKNM